MNQKKHKYIILFITITVIATVGLQLYWNLKNYKENKRRLINEVQIAFDNSIEHYYVEDIKNDVVTFIGKSGDSESFVEAVKKDPSFKQSIKRIKAKEILKPKKTDDTIFTKIEYKINYVEDGNTSNKKMNMDSIRKMIDSITPQDIQAQPKLIDKPQKIMINHSKSAKTSPFTVFKGKKKSDSISGIKDLTNRIIISMTRDSIDFKKLNITLKKELARKKIDISFAIAHFKADSLFEKFQPVRNANLSLETISKSTYLPQNQSLKLFFSNPTVLILKRSITEMILSLLLSLAVIGCLLYLLKTINKQKRIDEIKNDLISNITHEFKTPITTISTAIEGIKIFNTENDAEKTKKYLSISENQLMKLETMVEKLLETSSLETDKLNLKKEKTNLIDLINDIIEKHRIICSTKTIQFHHPAKEIIANVDVFHFENVISNLVDNAVKYGGDLIQVSIETNGTKTTIKVEDNGKGIKKMHSDKIFEKFYRIPKGNIHDVKGYGIGLYYAEKITQKHNGELKLISDSKTTSFKITLPNDI